MDSFVDFLLSGTGLSFLEFVILCIVAFLGSYITAALGIGGGSLTIATMALIMPPAVLVPIHGVVQLGSNFSRAVLLFRDIVKSVLPYFVLGSIIGIVVGGQVVVALPVYLLQYVLVVFILYSAWAPKFTAQRPKNSTFFGVGVVGAFTTMFVGATGPLVAPFALAASENRQQFVGTHASFMTIHHTLKLVTFGLLGFAYGPFVPLLIGLVALGFIGTYFGKMTLNRLPEELFRKLLKMILTVMAVKLFYDATVTALQ